MGKVRPREASKQETRDALIAAATSELAEKGLETASLDAICARAGFTRGAFYVHFKDRDELVGAVVDRMLTKFFDAVIATSDAPEDLERTVGQYVAMVASQAPVVHGTGGWRYHNTLSACARSPALRARYASLQQEAMSRVAKAARAGQRAGTVRKDVPAQAVAEVLVILTMGIGVMLDLEIPFDLAGGAKALKAMLRAKSRARRP